MTMISEATAWHILHLYAQECAKIDPSTLLAIYATGSLPGGYYRPGQSDIDAVLIVENGAELVWGNSEEVSPALQALNRFYREKYKIPKDFGPFPLQPSELYPPYRTAVDLLPLEIARLKRQGKLIYGAFDMMDVPMPTSADFLTAAQRFEAWWSAEFAKSTPLEVMSPTACVNTILIHLSRFLQIKKNIIEFNKHKIIPTYLAHQPPYMQPAAFACVETLLAGGDSTPAYTELLRGCVAELRSCMNTHLGIVTDP